MRTCEEIGGGTEFEFNAIVRLEKLDVVRASRRGVQHCRRVYSATDHVKNPAHRIETSSLLDLITADHQGVISCKFRPFVLSLSQVVE